MKAKYRMFFEKNCPNFPIVPNSSPENDVTEKLKVETAKLIFRVLCKSVVIIDEAPWENSALTILISKSQ